MVPKAFYRKDVLYFDVSVKSITYRRAYTSFRLYNTSHTKI
jgi:hypothetical protein